MIQITQLQATRSIYLRYIVVLASLIIFPKQQLNQSSWCSVCRDAIAGDEEMIPGYKTIAVGNETLTAGKETGLWVMKH
jgi:hypothetical protein